MQNHFIVSLCWTLIHSIWQGLLLALITGAALLIMKRSCAAVRYRVLVALFALFAGVSVFTFCREWSANAAHESVPASGMQNQTRNAKVDAVAIGTAEIVAKPLATRFREYFDTHASMIVMVWFIIFMARFVQLTAGVAYTYRLKHYRTYEVPAEWKLKLAQLLKSLRMRQPVRMAESGLVKIPMVMGTLKPVILLPMGLLSRLPGDEIEAILLHELSHIARRDYLVNLLQSFTEALFFFNPALMWLSALIREERENCCDDMAISVTRSKSKFINALISFQEYNHAPASYQLGFPGRKNQLLNRVKRIAGNQNKMLNATEKSLLTLGLAVLMMVSFAASKRSDVVRVNTSNANGTAKGEDVQALKNAVLKVRNEMITAPTAPEKLKQAVISGTDTVPPPPGDAPGALTLTFSRDTAEDYQSISTNISRTNGKETITIDASRKDHTSIRFTRENGVLRELFINGEKIPPADFEKYRDDVNTLEWLQQRRSAQSREEKKRAIEERLNARSKTFQLDNGMKTGTLNKQQALDMKEAEMRKRERNQDLLRLKQNSLTSKDSLELAKLRAEDKQMFAKHKELEHMKAGLSELKSESQGRWSKEKVLRDTLGKLNSLDFPLQNKKWRIERDAEDDERMQQSAGIIRNILDDLKRSGISVDPKTSWFALDKTRFLVDGKEMGSDIRQQFIVRYIKNHNWGYYFGPVPVHGTGVFLNYEDLSR